jgi:O-antigen/teichoic acid export membrane protein
MATGRRPSRRWMGKRAFGETALVNAGVLLLGAVTGIVTARVLGAEGRGVYSLAVAVAAMATIGVGLGLQQALAFTVASDPTRAERAVFLSVAVAIGGGMAGLVVGVPLVHELVSDSNTATAISIGLVSLPLSLFGGNVIGVFQGLRLGRPFNALRLITPFAFALLLLAAIGLPGAISPGTAVMLWVLSQGSAVFLAVWLLRRDHIGVKRAPRRFITATICYGLVVNLDTLAWQVNRYAGLLVLGAAGTLTQVGLFSVGLGYGAPVGILALAIAIHTLPDISAAGHAARAEIAVKRIRTAVVTTLPLAILGVIAAPFLIPFAYGADFRRGVGTAQILIIAQAALGVAQVMAEISRGLGRPGLPAVASLAGALGAMGVIPLLLPRYGIEGVAFGTVGAYAIMLIILILGLRRYLEDDREANMQSALEGPVDW